MSLLAYSNCQQLYFHPLPCQKLCIEIDLSCDSQSFHNASKILSWDLIFYLYPCTFLFELFPPWAQVSHHAGQYWRQKFLQWWNTHTDTNQRVLRVFLIQFFFSKIYWHLWARSHEHCYNLMICLLSGILHKTCACLRKWKYMVSEENNMQCMQINFIRCRIFQQAPNLLCKIEITMSW